MRRTQKLTIKQKKFADEYIKTGNATEAYKKAYSTKKMSYEAISSEAKRTLLKPLVKDFIYKRIKELEDASDYDYINRYRLDKERINEA